jgi:hypothetical protein
MICVYCHWPDARMAVAEFKPYLGKTVLRGVCVSCTPKYEAGEITRFSGLTPTQRQVMNPDRTPQVSWGSFVGENPIPVPAVYHSRR